MVGAELLLARETFLNTPGWEVKIHPNTQKLREQLRGSLESVFSLKNIKSLVTDRCLDILKKCQEVATLNHKLAA